MAIVVATSLYDMIPAKPQQAKPFGHGTRIEDHLVLDEGTVVYCEK